MNFKWMPELEQPYGYPLLMTCMLSLCGYLYWRLRRAGWI
jgi:magnesium transporter